ncbi:hypothetical protein [Maioricimonas sp. JC845]|uniref:hypothetical protein n=1 Tax=Maioricimonas sp. JC845 TaxID=3232138 RepID=UPI00345770AA
MLRLLIITALLATITSTLRTYPQQIAYFNEAAGGPQNGHRHLLGSSVDWNQDLLLCHELAAAQGRTRVYYAGRTTWPVEEVFPGWSRWNERDPLHNDADSMTVVSRTWLSRYQNRTDTQDRPVLQVEPLPLPSLWKVVRVDEVGSDTPRAPGE